MKKLIALLFLLPFTVLGQPGNYTVIRQGTGATITTNSPGKDYTIGVSGGVGVLSQFGTTNTGPVLTNILKSLATNVVNNNVAPGVWTNDPAWKNNPIVPTVTIGGAVISNYVQVFVAPTNDHTYGGLFADGGNVAITGRNKSSSSNDVDQGEATGVIGTAGSGLQLNFGVLGFSTPKYVHGGTNIGVAGMAAPEGSDGVYVGGFFGVAEDDSQPTPLALQNSALTLDNFTHSDWALFTARTNNGTTVFQVTGKGNLKWQGVEYAPPSTNGTAGQLLTGNGASPNQLSWAGGVKALTNAGGFDAGTGGYRGNGANLTNIPYGSVNGTLFGTNVTLGGTTNVPSGGQFNIDLTGNVQVNTVISFKQGAEIGEDQVTGDVVLNPADGSGRIVAFTGGFEGNGADLTSLNASQLTSGTVPSQSRYPVTNFTVYASGTAYTLTGTSAALDFGTTDPVLTINQAGTYLIQGNVGLKYNGATYASAQTVTFKFRRTNNTAADLSNGSRAVEMPFLVAGAAFTGGDVMTLPPVIYTATSGDLVTIFGILSATPPAGSVITDSCELVAIRLY